MKDYSLIFALLWYIFGLPFKTIEQFREMCICMEKYYNEKKQK